MTERLLAGIDADDRRHLLITLQPTDAEMHDEQSRGLLVATSDLVVAGHDPARYLDLICADPAGYDAFDLIGGELGARLAAGEGPADSVTRILSKWRRFWGEVPRTLLSREAQLGLFAEVWFLTFWLIPRVGPMEAVTRWR